MRTTLQSRLGRTGAVARTPASARRLVARAAAVQVDSKDAVIEKQVHEFLSKLPPGARRVNAKEFEEPIEKLKKLGEELQLNHVIPERLVGCIHGRLTTDQREFEGDITTLGRAAFSLFGPKDLKIDLAPSSVDAKLEATGLPGFYRGPFEDMKNGYILFNLFKIVDERAGSGEPLYGIINVIAEYGVPTDDKPKNICTVQFKEMRLLPSPEVAANPALFARWKELFKPHNETMDERGCVDTKLPKSPLGTLEYFMCGNKYQLQRGNLGTYTILEMYQPEPGSKKAQYVQQFASQSYFSPIPGK